MKITLPRCIKPPGLIIRAKTYFLELNDKGLYMIALGNATVMPNTRTYFQQAVAERAVSHFDKKYETEIQKNYQRISNGELDQLASEKYSYFLMKNDVQKFDAAPDGFGGIKIEIKGNGVTLKVHAPMQLQNEVEEMKRNLWK